MADEARSMLDALMGGDRNAPLPSGTAVPKSKKRSSDSSTPLLLPTKRSKSCYDNDVDPLYCAWGIDVYDLFVNTKSDIGANPNVTDDGARQEYMGLPKHEQERLGFDGVLFGKLLDLVRQCDRTVSRNKEKLEQEIQRQLQKREGRDYVEDVDEMAIDSLARLRLQVDGVEDELLKVVEVMENNVQQEKEVEERRDELTNQLTKVEQESKLADGAIKIEEKPEKSGESNEIKVEEKEADDEGAEKEPVKEESDQESEKIKADPDEEGKEVNENDSEENTEIELKRLEVEEITKELRDVTLKKQRSLFDLARKMQQYAPIQESADQQLKQLHFVKSDITMDKTVCEVSGNFMSARDADERIAAHYAGKQYVGWKLVRDKLKQMQQEYGRNGPPNRRRGNFNDDNRRGNMFDDRRGGGPRSDDRYNRGNGNDRYQNRGPAPQRGNFGGPPSGGRDFNRPRDRGGYGGGGGGYGGRGGGGRRDGRWGR
mmetsp:Transcript_19652/g.29161  ORF Transcript_19652/g.29161 Transcript_19652/m.29161 type:complete len:486 (+) Transcript_19652:145-1602(+)|eukprot:CAMPEP_0194217294 /NCGR_PEP_ID=MMETSP0156-20130528/20924_1 /TAXON_ID=33649 /ORGANISM="Thalassionema nitzschioides, Strain L26-B" /LENGTH=485 /DNA_ID=CAMNT_0038946307 /DNA_START=101 /DNA_END=1558 /DNA_ORIENTATION=-